MNARELTPVALAASALPSSNPGTASTLDLPAARALRDGLRSLLGAERNASAEFLLALAGFDARRGWEPLGHASLFAFLVAELKLSKGGASFRLTAARLVQRFPDVIVPLRDGRLCITTVFELAKVLTEKNLADVLPRFFGLSSAEAKEVVAALAPRDVPPLRTVVTPTTEPARVTLLFGGTKAVEHGPKPVGVGPLSHQVQSTEPNRPARVPERRDDVEPLTGDLRRLHVTVSARLLKKIAAARDGLSHALPNATTGQVLEAALDLLLEKQAKARGQVKHPPKANEVARAEAPIPADRPRLRRAGPRAAIPAAVKRAVWARDGGRCSWPIDGGGCCGSTHRLELDHVMPWAKGGDDSPANLRLVCGRHNALAARREFGFDYAGRGSERSRSDGRR